MRPRSTLPLALLAVALATAASAAVTDPDDIADVARQAPGAIEHCDEAIEGREFAEIFACGDDLFETRFNAVDGVGANVGNGQRFTSTPRFDLSMYANIMPKRVTGPNAQSCNTCHASETIGGGGDSSGLSALNNTQDLAGVSGVLDARNFVERNTPHLFGMAGIQLAAEEMTRDLQRTRASAIASACSNRQVVTASLASKGVSFGQIRVTPTGCPSPVVDTSRVAGVDADLVINPFGWKGTFPSVRLFSAGAFHNELGMTPTEFSGPDVDSDFDGVENEISIEDVSAMTVYLAAQPRPTTLIELDNLRRTLLALGAGSVIEDLGLPALTVAQRAQIGRGSDRFAAADCATCHTPALVTNGRTFAEPSPLAAYRFDFGVDPRLPQVVDPANPLTFDITLDQPDNVIQVGNTVVRRLGSFEPNGAGGAIVRSYGDLKRHDMGRQLAESIGEPEPLDAATKVPPSIFLTAELWGVGNTAPYLHDGRASTIEEAILEHGGEAAASRDRFRALSPAAQADLLAFLNNLVLFFPAAQEDGED